MATAENIQFTENEQKRIARIPWDSFKEKGIDVEALRADADLVRDIINFRVTGPVNGTIEGPDGAKVEGPLYLRAYFTRDESRPFTVTFDTVEEKKTMKDRLYFGKCEITSESAKRRLLAVTNWEGRDGKRCFGLAYANAGTVIAYKEFGREDGKNVLKGKKQYLVSYDYRVNKCYGVEVEEVAKILTFNNTIYKKQLTEDQLFGNKEKHIRGIVEGGVAEVVLDNGSKVYCQFDCISRDLKAVHPLALKELQSIATAETVEVKAAPEQKKDEKKEETRKTSSKKAVKPIEEPAKKTKGAKLSKA